MIIHKEQIDHVFQDGTKGKKLLVSYIGKSNKVEFLQYAIPPSEMYEWVYASKNNAEPPFYEFDYTTNEYKKDENGNLIERQWKSYDNKPVRKVPVKELPDNRINELLCSFGNKIDPVFEMNIPDTWFCDIETDVTDEGFPDPEVASTQINTISMTKFPQTIIFSRKNLEESEKQWIQQQIDTYSEINGGGDITKGYKFEFRYYETEREMLEDFLLFIKEIPAIGGWNYLGFDWLYIYNRCKRNNLDIDSISPTRKNTNFKLTPRSGGNTINVTIPMHKIIYDYLLVFKTWDMTVDHAENHTLDYIAMRVLGIKKVAHEWGFGEFYRDHFKEYCFYNAIDTILLEQIDKKIHTANIWYMLTSILRIELNMAFSTIKPTEVVMGNFIYNDFKVMPKVKMNASGEQEKYEGAFVWPTYPMIARLIGGLDFASLYPSIMRQFGISPECFKFKDINYLPKEDEIKTASGAVYRKDKNAIIPAILTHYFALRKQAKNDMKQADSEANYLNSILKQRLKNI